MFVFTVRLAAGAIARGAGLGIEAAEPHRSSEAPIASGTSRYRPRGGLEAIPGGYGATCGGSRLVDHNPQETPAALAPVRDGSLPRVHLLWAATFLLLEAIAGDAHGDPDDSALALERDPGLAEAALVAEIAGLLGDVKWSAPASAEPLWPGEPLTDSETRVLRYLPTHMGAPEIAAELFLSTNTVKTHLRHLYRKLGAHSRREAGQRARAIGLLTVSSRRSLRTPRRQGEGSWHTGTPNVTLPSCANSKPKPGSYSRAWTSRILSSQPGYRKSPAGEMTALRACPGRLPGPGKPGETGARRVPVVTAG
jgi:DNA-binding CsgD family transcriptional regulator